LCRGSSTPDTILLVVRKSIVQALPRQWAFLAEFDCSSLLFVVEFLFRVFGVPEPPIRFVLLGPARD
jgi:hypothetical protein